jgi:hypothetical protein
MYGAGIGSNLAWNDLCLRLERGCSASAFKKAEEAMTAWEYFDTAGLRWSEPVNTEITDSDVVETVGRRELALMRRARAAETHTIVLLHTREANADRMAVRRLVARELLQRPLRMGGAPGRDGQPIWLYTYTLTDRGASCWLRVKASA